MIEEMTTLDGNGTWDLVSHPTRKKAIDCKWVFAIKVNPDGTVAQLKAHLVAKVDHWDVVEQISCYLKVAPGRGILYKDHVHTRVECFSDADWVGCRKDKRSNFGYYVFLGENLVS
ncbi:putative helicase chr10 [Cucumis melo var. makuwa]|uniref:Helicase chr10 n=1 Tax=Cucumis melo var. makuwa TaxID=1194695 RepID=A0A5A7UMJ8_CUCMM|nr:putative helicase chr10 [Cucumis melo var. makuwa]TYK08593.1 putative helicase chr10 [Cucumis melo var. makuwa]